MKLFLLTLLAATAMPVSAEVYGYDGHDGVIVDNYDAFYDYDGHDDDFYSYYMDYDTVSKLALYT